jgi:rhomboid protease GluP
VITVLVTISNIAVLAWMVATGVDPMSPALFDLVRWGANHGPLTIGDEWWRLITACWIHGGIIHLAFNMYVLWDLGRMTERVYGSLGFAIVYLVAGIGGSFLSVSLNPMVTSVGASGAVFGVAGAFLAFLLRNRTRIDPRVSSQLRRSMVSFIVLNLAIGFMIPNIDWAGHVGGLLTGMVGGAIAAPAVGPAGPERPIARYPIVALLGAAMCAAAALGFTLRGAL